MEIKNLLKKYTALSPQVKATLWYTLCNLLQKGISLIVVPLYTRILTTEQYGAYTVFLSWLEIFEIIATFRISWGGYIVGLTKYEQDRDGYTSSMQCLSFTLTSICLMGYLAVPQWVNRVTGMSLPLTLMIFGLLYTLPAISFWTARQRVEYRYVGAVAVTMISSFLVPVLGVAAALTIQHKEVAVIGARVIVQGCLGAVLIYVNCRKRFVFFHKEYWKRAISFNGALLPYYFSMVLLNSSDRIIIQSLIGQEQAGIYGVAYSASMVMQLFNTSLNASLQPWMFRKLKEKNDAAIGTPVYLSLLVVGALNLALIAFAPEAITLLAPPAYREAIWLVPPLAASVFVMFFYQHFVNVEFYFEESKMIAVASIGAAVLNVGLNFALIPVFGYIAAGYTTLFCYSVFGMVHYGFMRVVCKKNGRSPKFLNIRYMGLLLLGFMALSTVLMAGYFFSLLRYGVIVVLFVLLWWKRGRLLAVYRQLKLR